MRRISALLLALLMTVSLTACSSPEEDAPTAGSEEGLFYEVTGLDPDAVMLTADGKDITVGMYLYWLVYTMSSVSTVSDWVDDAGLLKWDEEVSEGETVRYLVLEETLNTAKLYMIVENWADQYGFTLTDEEEQSVQAELDTMAQQLGGEEAYQAYLWDMGLTEEMNQRLTRVYYLYAKMLASVTEEGSPLYITDEVLYQYEGITEDTILADHILLLTGEDEEENQALYATMEQLLQTLRSADPSEASLLFNYLADNISEDTGRAYYPNGYLLTEDSDYVQEFKDAAFALEENEFSGIVTTEYGYHIIMRKPIREYVADRYLSELLTVAIDNADVTFSDAYNTFDVEQFQVDYQTYTALHSAVKDMLALNQEASDSGDASGSGDDTAA